MAYQQLTFQPPPPIPVATTTPNVAVIGSTQIPRAGNLSQQIVPFQPPVTTFIALTPQHVLYSGPARQVITAQPSLTRFQPPIPPPSHPEAYAHVLRSAPVPVVYPPFPYAGVGFNPLTAINAGVFDYAAALRVIAHNALPFNTPIPPPPVIGCNLTVAAMTQTIWTRLNDDGTYYAPDRVLRAINVAQNLWCLLTLCVEKTVTLNLAATTTWYSILNDFALTDYLLPLRVLYNGARIKPATLNQLSCYGNWRTAPGVPRYYFQQGLDLFALYPQPRASDPLTGALQLTYAAVPPQLVNAYDLPAVSEECQPWIVDGATYIVRLNEGEAEANVTQPYFERFMTNAAKYGQFIRARSKAQNYDQYSFDLASYDEGRRMAQAMSNPSPQRRQQ
jgi:hypothetical protein